MALGGRLSADQLGRVKQALRIKNVTALKSIARELAEAPETRELGREIEQLAGHFSFTALTELLAHLERQDDA
jgi:hypothetical protein